MFRQDRLRGFPDRTGCWLLVACLIAMPIVSVEGAPPLREFDTIAPDAAGVVLRESFIWASSSQDTSGVAIAFRRTFVLDAPPTQASLLLFADARYVLWVNGDYVDRGPSRFQPNGPQYDVVDLTAKLRPGQNAIVLLVVGNLSGGKIMLHSPGLTALLEVNGRQVLRTDSTWKWSDSTRFRKASASWADLRDGIVDARVEDGDWTRPEYNDAAWKPAAAIRPDAWGPLTRSLIPPLRESTVPITFKDNGTLPVTLQAGERLEFDTGRIVQAYPVLHFNADAGTEISVEPFGLTFLARAGPDRHFTIDTRGLSRGAIVLKSGRATITEFRLVERLYPFQRIGSFTSNDEFLNKLWRMCARSCEVLSEDCYVDCADRERVEWMDCSPPGFEITRVAMAGPGQDGNLVYSDPRLLGALVRRTALTLQPEGWVKAHTASDRYDIHARMEDRACAWVEGVRQYYEATGDTSLVREIWPAIVAQMDYFLERRTPRGLVRARDWVVWGNPVGYRVGEGTTLNVFVQRALADAAHLGERAGHAADAARFARAAEQLGAAINSILWDETAGAYYAGYFTDADIAENLAARRELSLPLTDQRAATTLHANVFALDRGIVPPQRRSRVVARMLEQERAYGDRHIMVHYYVIKQLYALDQPQQDLRVLDLFRSRWAKMVADPWECSWEGFDWGSKAHIYGMYPGYFLSTYVLGVRRDADVSNRRLMIEPHLADLMQAGGVVVTEFGPVSISWTREGESLSFSCDLPAGATASLRLPLGTRTGTLLLDGKIIRAQQAGTRLETDLAPGKHIGRLEIGPDNGNIR